MKTINILFLAIGLFAFGCSKPVAVEVKDACSQAVGSSVIVQGYISLPERIETIQLTRKGAIEAVGLQLFVMTKTDASGDSVRTTFWTSDKGEPNKIKPLTKGYTWNDLLVYTDDGKTIGPGKLVKVTGKVEADDKYKCIVNVGKIENP